MKILNIEEITSVALTPEDYVVFGGTFDPIHEGHVTVIKRILSFFVKVIVAPTEANPWKKEKPTPLALRKAMIEEVLRAENLPLAASPEQNGVRIETYPYFYSEELVDYLRTSQSGTLYWAVGADSAESVKDWRNWKDKQVTTLVLPIEIHAHAVLVRTGQALAHPAIRPFIKQRHLYGQS